ncbi:hypothetical protein PO002_27910 [Cupriavidus necator]|uniref:hypothetical protein n=1 Tax=Cupriavidus necator TaxID=106590 RepID=UPI0039C47E09
MTRVIRFALHCLAAASLAFLSTAHATDIDCDPASTRAGLTPSQRLICESALFSMGYQRIYADQQRLLKAGSITEADLAAFRKKRDSCNSAPCLDTVFREWKAFAAQAHRKQ